MTRPSHWLQVSEYTALGSSVIGTITAVVSQQAIYAAVPIMLTIGLNVINRQRFNQLNQSLSNQIYQLDMPIEDKLKNYSASSKADKPDATNHLISSSTRKTSITLTEELIVKLNETIELATVNSDIDDKTLQKILVFISQSIEAIKKCLIDILDLLNNLKYMTFEDIRNEEFFECYLRPWGSFSSSHQVINAKNLCDRLRVMRESYENYILPVLIEKNIIDVSSWVHTLFELIQTRDLALSEVGTVHKEICASLYKIDTFSRFKSYKDNLDNIDENQLKKVVEEINNKAHQYFDVFDTFLKKLLRLHNKILGQSGEVGFLEMINDRSSLVKQAKIFFTHIGDQSVSETFNNDLREANIANFANQNKDNARQQANQNIYQSEQKQTLAEAAEEIQNLLKVLEKTNPTATEMEKKSFVTSAIPPKRRSRIIKALEAGGEKALEEFLKNPYVNVAVAIVKEWQKTSTT